MVNYITDISSDDYDYVIVGGGLCGCVVASRLSEAGHSVLVIEAGNDEHDNPAIKDPLGPPLLHNTKYEYNYQTVPQPNFNNRNISTFGGKALSGSSAVNYGMWSRGDSKDFDAWGAAVGDERWSYKGFLKYFRRTETHHTPGDDAEAHGFEGPQHTMTGDRGLPLWGPIKEAYDQAGVPYNPDSNGGCSLGYSPYNQNFRNAAKQPAGYVYDMSRVHIITNSFVQRVIFDTTGARPKATSIELVDGKVFKASKEVIVSCGAIKTPQILMLSGVGPKEQLEKFNIPKVFEAPGVGRNFHDHSAVAQWWQLREPEKGQAVLHPKFMSTPAYCTGMPIDWISWQSAPMDAMRAAVQKDGTNIASEMRMLDPNRAHYEHIYLCGPAGDVENALGIPKDGSIVTGCALALLLTSRGTIDLASTDPRDHPLVDPNFMSTEVDRTIQREALKFSVKISETPAAQAVFKGEYLPKGYKPLTSKSTDEEFDERVKINGTSFSHASGSTAMGIVVDTDCKFMGIDNLRIVDASIMPMPISAHYQVMMYATAEHAADIILGLDPRK